jgi:hypothetical protein
VQGSASGNVLQWTASANDVANDFVIQRSADGVNWQDLTTITAGTAQANYSYTDATPLPGENFYRLQLLDAGGSTTGYSVVATVVTQTLSTIRLYPNPFTDMINISSPVAFSRVVVHDAPGRTLQVKEYGSGVNSAQISAASLPAGVYFVQVDAATYKLIKN